MVGLKALAEGLPAIVEALNSIGLHERVPPKPHLNKWHCLLVWDSQGSDVHGGLSRLCRFVTKP